MPRIPRKIVTLPPEIYNELDRLAKKEGLSASYLAKKAIQVWLKNPVLGSLEVPRKTLSPEPTDVRKNPDGSYTRREGAQLVTYRDGVLVGNRTVEEE